MTTSRIVRIALTVSALDAAEAFYVHALGFSVQSRAELPPSLARLLGAKTGRQSVLIRGGQTLALETLDPQGAAPSIEIGACDQAFQHFAMPTADIRAAVARLPAGTRPISRGGPQTLPLASGGATAYKFRDPDQHPLELIQLPQGNDHGIDHSAIVVADAERSIAFYRDRLGLRLKARQINTGPEQDRLDGLDGVAVEVVALAPAQPTPHLELLAYRRPLVRAAAPPGPRDLAATRLVFAVDGLDAPALVIDPDGHRLLLLPP